MRPTIQAGAFWGEYFGTFVREESPAEGMLGLHRATASSKKYGIRKGLSPPVHRRSARGTRQVDPIGSTPFSPGTENSKLEGHERKAGQRPTPRNVTLRFSFSPAAIVRNQEYKASDSGPRVRLQEKRLTPSKSQQQKPFRSRPGRDPPKAGRRAFVFPKRGGGPRPNGGTQVPGLRDGKEN